MQIQESLPTDNPAQFAKPRADTSIFTNLQPCTACQATCRYWHLYQPTTLHSFPSHVQILASLPTDNPAQLAKPRADTRIFTNGQPSVHSLPSHLQILASLQTDNPAQLAKPLADTGIFANRQPCTACQATCRYWHLYKPTTLHSLPSHVQIPPSFPTSNPAQLAKPRADTRIFTNRQPCTSCQATCRYRHLY